MRVLLVQHVFWEDPHRIGRAFEAAGFDAMHCRPLDGEPLPPHDQVDAAVFMGGPMNVDQFDRYPGLLAEREWLTDAIPTGLPILGVCLGSQLIARAAGALVVPGAAPELGWLPVNVFDADDPVVGPLAPSSTVLHWHGDVFDLPPGAQLLASSEATTVQAFRVNNAWGVLFHAEADEQLVSAWLAEPSMRDEALAVLGDDAPGRLIAGSADVAAALTPSSQRGFEAFADFAATRS